MGTAERQEPTMKTVTQTAQCTRCSLVTDRAMPADGHEDDTDTALVTEDTCPRCGHDRVLAGSVRGGEEE